MTRPILIILAVLLAPPPARAWGDEGHQIIALVANALLDPATRRAVDALLATDEDPLSGHDIAGEATWADHLRDSNADGARRRTAPWHFVDNELDRQSLANACFGHPALPPGTPASLGPAHACIIDKIDQFGAELAARGTPVDERLLALKFLLHLVGDLHQPLHASDDDDRGGNDKLVTAEGFRAGRLHHFWDTEFVRLLGADPRQVATNLLHDLTPDQRRRWSAGTPRDWALDSFAIAARDAYGLLPSPSNRGSYRLDSRYIEAARRDVRLQLTKAGVRLAVLLQRTMH